MQELQPSESAEGRTRFGGLWRHSNFVKLWSGQAVSDVGSEVTMLVLPLAAVVVLHATALQVGLLRAASSGPQLLFSSFAGIMADRMARRHLLITSDLSRAFVLATIPLAALLGVLHMWLLLVGAFVAGTFDTLFAVAYQAFLPSVVSPANLVEGNSKLQTTGALAQVAGPSLGGALMQVIAAPVVILVDALSFLFSAVMLWLMRMDETVVARNSAAETGRRFLAELSVGWRHLTADPLLRAIGGTSTTLALFFGIQQAVLIVYLSNVLRISPFAIGIILAVGSVGGVVGALLSGSVGNRNLGPTLIGAIVVNTVGATMLGVASGAAAVPLLICAQFFVGVSFPLYYVKQTSLRQAASPSAYLGRITAAFAVMSWGIIPVGALLGGLLSTLVSVQATLLIGGIGKLAAVVWLLLSPVRQIRRLPTPA